MIYSKIIKNHYVDSLESLFSSGVLSDQEGIEVAFASMAKKSFKETLKEEGMLTPEIETLSEADFVIVAKAESIESFNNALLSLEDENKEEKISYRTLSDAVSSHPEANLCSIAVPGEYALAEVTKALNKGLHCVVFSNNVPLSDERKMKELALEKGLLCMGPDCGVANINGAALVLASINNRGPFGICGASGTGIQHVAAILHECGTGVSQTIGTGGNDLKEPVGGIMMRMGLSALEHDENTKYIILISRKPSPSVLEPIFEEIEKCTKPVVVYFMGCEKETVESHGAIWAGSLDDTAQKALSLVGLEYKTESEKELEEIASRCIEGVSKEQKYLRGMYTGGTYLDEAMNVMVKEIGDVWSNAPLSPEMKLASSTKSKENTCIDYGEEEFTLGRPHPAIDPSIRVPFIYPEAMDKETAVVILDFILTPPGHMDPVGFILPEVKRAQRDSEKEGRKVIFIATVLGTDKDLQNKNEQIKKLEDESVIVLKTNYTAALLASKIVKKLGERQ